jgi:hypothetical protein
MKTSTREELIRALDTILAGELYVSPRIALRVVLDDHHVLLRAEREGGGDGRIYTTTITCTDSGGNSSNDQVEVTVLHDQGR